MPQVLWGNYIKNSRDSLVRYKKGYFVTRCWKEIAANLGWSTPNLPPIWFVFLSLLLARVIYECSEQTRFLDDHHHPISVYYEAHWAYNSSGFRGAKQSLKTNYSQNKAMHKRGSVIDFCPADVFVVLVIVENTNLVLIFLWGRKEINILTKEDPFNRPGVKCRRVDIQIKHVWTSLNLLLIPIQNGTAFTSHKYLHFLTYFSQIFLVNGRLTPTHFLSTFKK